MSWTTIDCTTHKTLMHAALDDIDAGHFETGIERLRCEAHLYPDLDGERFTEQARKLARIDTKYAHRLVDALSDSVLRAWLRIPLRVLLWPVVFAVRLVRMGMPS